MSTGTGCRRSCCCWDHFQAVLLSSGSCQQGCAGGFSPVCVCLCVCPQITLYSMYVAIMAFNAKVSDPLIGGTYMTLLNTVSNLGGNWPSTVALWLVDPLTVKECAGAQGHTCATAAATEVSLGAGGSLINGFLWEPSQYIACAQKFPLMELILLSDKVQAVSSCAL